MYEPSKTSRTIGAMFAAALAASPIAAQAGNGWNVGLTGPTGSQTTQQQHHYQFADGLIKPVHEAAGYDVLTLDAHTKAVSNASAIEIGPAYPNAIIVYNFTDHSTPELAKYSDLQTNVLEDAMKQIAPTSTAKRLMLVNIDVQSYQTDYATFYKAHPLNSAQYERPYGVVAVGGQDKFSFGIVHNVKTGADLHQNIVGIVGRLGITVDKYNNQVAQVDHNF